MATQGTTFASSSKDSLIPPTSNLIPPTSNPAAHGLPSVYATFNDLTDGGTIQSTFDDEYTPLEVPISPAMQVRSLQIEIDELDDQSPSDIHLSAHYGVLDSSVNR